MKNNSFIRIKLNDFGTEVSEHVCTYCGNIFTVCPSDPTWGGGCMSKECSSYVKECDIDLLFETNSEKIKLISTGRYN